MPGGCGQNQRHDHDDRGGRRFSIPGNGIFRYPGNHYRAITEMDLSPYMLMILLGGFLHFTGLPA